MTEALFYNKILKTHPLCWLCLWPHQAWRMESLGNGEANGPFSLQGLGLAASPLRAFSSLGLTLSGYMRADLPVRKVCSTTVYNSPDRKQSKHPSQRNEHRRRVRSHDAIPDSKESGCTAGGCAPQSRCIVPTCHGARNTKAGPECDATCIKLKEAELSRCEQGCVDRWCKQREKQGWAVSESGAAG